MIGDDDLERYARQLIMPQIGEEGQQRLLDANLLVVGAGGLGAPATLYLAGAGIGRITVIDDESVETSNLNRQITHTTAGVGSPKVEQVARAVAALNPGVALTARRGRMDVGNADSLVAAHDLVVDCTDSFDARLLIAGAAHRNSRAHVFAGAVGTQGQLAVFKSGVREGRASPCFGCVFPAAPGPRQAPGCEQAGILGPVTGIMGSMQALEAIKLVAQTGSVLEGRLLLFDGDGASFTEIETERREGCPVCAGPART